MCKGPVLSEGLEEVLCGGGTESKGHLQQTRGQGQQGLETECWCGYEVVCLLSGKQVRKAGIVCADGGVSSFRHDPSEELGGGLEVGSEIGLELEI
jgi:hypothetical protein